MSMNIFGTKLQQGRHYMTLWPRRPELNSMFPENRVIKATEFALKVIPALAVLSVMLQFQFGELRSTWNIMQSGSARYRKFMVRNLVRRALEDVWKKLGR